ncbi:MAG: BRO family protein [Pseudomonadota bacterium]
MAGFDRTITLHFNGTGIRIVGIDGKPWVVAADVFRALGITNTTTAVKALGKDEVRLVEVLSQRPVQALSEKGLRKRLMRSTKPGAKALLDWAVYEALPAYREAHSTVPAGEGSSSSTVFGLAARIAELEQQVRALRTAAST